jgi:hypothetical protein
MSLFRAMLLAQARAQLDPKRRPPPPIPAPTGPTWTTVASATPGPPPASPVSDPIPRADKPPQSLQSGARHSPLLRRLAMGVARRHAKTLDDPFKARAAADALPHLVVCMGGGEPQFFLRQPGRAFESWDAGWNVSRTSTLAAVMAMAETRNVTIIRRPLTDLRTVPERLSMAVVPAGGLLVLLGGNIGVLVENGSAELLGEVDAAVMVRMAIEMPNYPFEIWSRPGWRWPAAEKEAA